MADEKISQLTEEAAALSATDVFAINVSGATRKVQLTNYETIRLLAKRPAATTENKLPQWNATNGTLKDGLTLQTAVADPGADTKVVSEQGIREMGDTLERWTPVAASKYTATPASTSQLTMSDTSDMAVGLPIKYEDSGGPFYAIITALVANTSITIAGAPFDVGDALTSLKVGQCEMVRQFEFFVSGTYGDGVADLLAADNNSAFKWGAGAAALVTFSGIEGSVDTGAEPKVNVKVGGNAVSTNDTNKGIQLNTTWVDNSAVAIDTTKYTIARGDAIEIACTEAGGTGDAADLTVTAVFVLA